MTEFENIVKILLEADEDEDIDLVKDVQGDPPPPIDFLFMTGGSICLVFPQNDAANDWLHRTAPEEAQFMGDALAVESRYVADVARAMMDDGWETNILFRPRKGVDVAEAEAEDDDADMVKEVGGGHKNYRKPPSNCPECHSEREWMGNGRAICHFCGQESVCEAEDDDETIKDILGVDYLEPPQEAGPVVGNVDRHDRWANITIGNNHFCISYLTPVAVYISGKGVYLTDKFWSKTTSRHMAKWASEIGLGTDTLSYHSLAQNCKRMTQDDITELFKREAQRVAWTKRHVKKSETFRPPLMGLKAVGRHRISLYPKEESLLDEDVVANLLEAEEEAEDFDVKELVEPGDEVIAGPTGVKRFGRIKIVDMPRYTFLISYLTPVAYYDKVFNTYYQTTKQWSPTTNAHIGQWARMIWHTPEWQQNPKNQEPSNVFPGGHYVRYPRFKRLRQARISGLFRSLIPTMQMKPHLKRRMYHVHPLMRQGSEMRKTWLSGHLKHHNSGEEGLPSPQDREFAPFFSDFDPPEPENWEWSSGLRNREPYEQGEPDEQ